MSTRTEWDPLKELAGVQKRMNTLFESAMARTNFETSEGLGSWAPVCDVYETDGAMVFCLELPGLQQEQIELRIDGDELVVEGQRKMDNEQAGEQHHRVERTYGSFSRRFNLPSTVDRDSVEATYRDGVLEVVLAYGGQRKPQPVRVSIE
jgi:HSP20 family protein